MIAEFTPAPFDDHHVPVVDPTQDLDGDGVMDTAVSHGGVLASVLLGTDAAGLELLSDLDGDGYADHATFVDEDDGSYAAWEFTSGPGAEWVQTDSGSL